MACFGTCRLDWTGWWDSNPQRADSKSAALPVELHPNIGDRNDFLFFEGLLDVQDIPLSEWIKAASNLTTKLSLSGHVKPSNVGFHDLSGFKPPDKSSAELDFNQHPAPQTTEVASPLAHLLLVGAEGFEPPSLRPKRSAKPASAIPRFFVSTFSV